MDFTISGLSATPFEHLYGLSEAELAAHGVLRYIADEVPGFPDRIEMRDGEIGESLLLLNYVHQDANSPYRACHAIFILEGATQTYQRQNTVPEVMSRRLQSLRAFDEGGMMLTADVAEGADIERTIRRMFEDKQVAYIHTHNAKQGCYSGRVDRA